MLLVQSSPTEIRQLDINTFRLELKDLEDDEGMPFLDTHSHNQPVTVGGVTLARVVEIINNYTITFEDGQYAVNLVGANSNIADVTNVNQVSVRSANSAGLTFSDQINAQSFTNNLVYVDTIDGLTGTSFPRGTPTDPVNNYEDARDIADSRELHGFHITSPLLIPLIGSDLSMAQFEGPSPDTSRLLLQGQDTHNSKFESMLLTGVNNGKIVTVYSALSDISNFDGSARECALFGTISLAQSGRGSFQTFVNCYSSVPGSGRPSLDVNNNFNNDIQFRGYTGGLSICNMTQGNDMTVDLYSGTVEVCNTCTSGTIVIRGVGHAIDNSGPNCTVITTGLIESDVINRTLDLTEADEVLTPTTLKKYKKGTSDELISKTVTGGSIQSVSITE